MDNSGTKIAELDLKEKEQETKEEETDIEQKPINW